MSDTSKSVQQGSAVYAHMTISIEDGSVAESTRANGKPSIIRIGDESISAAMEQELLGLAIGTTKKFDLEADDAFGQPNPNLIQFIDLHHFPQDMDLAPGTLIAFEQPSGGKMPGIIRSVQGHSVKVDFNHPLAGHKVTFDVEVLSIDEPPTTH